MKNIAFVVASLTGIFLVSNYVSADTQLSNLQQPNSYVEGLGRDAIQFLTGNLAPVWNVDSVTLSFGGPNQWGARDNGPILYDASISNDVNNAPASQLVSLGSFNFTDQTAHTALVTFTPLTGPQLPSTQTRLIGS